MPDKDTILERVRKLLDKADSTTFEEEAATYREKADALMLQYAIESFEVDAARKEGSKERESIVLHKFVICKSDNPVKDQLVNLAGIVASHVRCRSVFYGMSTSPKWKMDVSIGVVGYESDVKYAEMLFTSLWLQLSANLEPKPDPELDDVDNFVHMLENGVSRKRIAELMGMPAKESSYQRISKAYIAWCKENDKVYHGRNTRPLPVTYARNYASAFTSRIGTRLYEIRKRQQEQVESTGKGIVLFDRNKLVSDAYNEMFPPKSLSTHRERSTAKFNAAAQERGREAGNRADLGQKRMANDKKELG